MATILRSPESTDARYGPGFTLGGAYSPVRVGSRVAVTPQLELAFVHRTTGEGQSPEDSLRLDTADVSLLLRGEIAVRRGSVYGMAGVHGGVMLRAQRHRDGGITDVRDRLSPVDAGWLAGAGVERTLGEHTRFSAEVRYRRGVRDLFPATPSTVTGQSIALLLGVTHSSTPSLVRTLPAPHDDREVQENLAALDALKTRVDRLVSAMEASSSATRWHRRRRGPCQSSQLPGLSGLLATPAECVLPGEDPQQATGDALRAVLLALTRDVAALVPRFRILARNRMYGEDVWFRLYSPMLEASVEHVDWMVTALDNAQDLLVHGESGRGDEATWRRAGQHYESVLLGAQVLSLWASWLEFARVLHLGSTLNIEWIWLRPWRIWKQMEPVLDHLRRGQAWRVRDAARILQGRLPAWSEALHDWGQEAAGQMRQAEEELQTLLLIQAAFEIATMRHAVGPSLARSRSLAFVLPGIGGVTAGGAATGVRVVISAEWLEAMRHLIAVGAITTVEIARLAGVSSLATSATPAPATPPIAHSPKTPHAPVSPGQGAAPRPVRVVVQHRAGNRQVEVDGRRWHLPKGKDPGDIPRSDPVGDRLQAAVDRIARGWNPSKLSRAERRAIKKARSTGKPWLARLLERQARGRWVESEVRVQFRQLKWKRRGVDAVDRRTGIQYEVLSGTRAIMRSEWQRNSFASSPSEERSESVVHRFHEVHIANEKVVWDDRKEFYYIGPDSVFRDSQIDIATSASGLILTRTRFINCTIRVKRALRNFSFCHAYIENCQLRGRFLGCEFGRRIEEGADDEPPLYYPEAGIVDTDLSEARLDGCRFINCDLSSLKLPLWPCFTVVDPEERWEQALRLPWPGDSRIIPETWCEQPLKTVAVIDDARVLCREFDVTEEELKAVVSRIPGVIM